MDSYADAPIPCVGSDLSLNINHWVRSKKFAIDMYYKKKIRDRQSHAMRSNAQQITRIGTVLCGPAIMSTFTEEKPPRITQVKTITCNMYSLGMSLLGMHALVKKRSCVQI